MSERFCTIFSEIHTSTTVYKVQSCQGTPQKMLYGILLMPSFSFQSDAVQPLHFLRNGKVHKLKITLPIAWQFGLMATSFRKEDWISNQCFISVLLNSRIELVITCFVLLFHETVTIFIAFIKQKMKQPLIQRRIRRMYFILNSCITVNLSHS